MLKDDINSKEIWSLNYLDLTKNNANHMRKSWMVIKQAINQKKAIFWIRNIYNNALKIVLRVIQLSLQMHLITIV